MARNLDDLFQFLDDLQGRAPLKELAAHVEQLDLNRCDLSSFIRFADDGYTHNLIRAGDWYNVWVICWKNGQRSPIHNHRGSSCVMRVVRGIMTETQFVFAANGHVKAIGSNDYAPGTMQ